MIRKEAHDKSIGGNQMSAGSIARAILDTYPSLARAISDRLGMDSDESPAMIVTGTVVMVISDGTAGDDRLRAGPRAKGLIEALKGHVSKGAVVIAVVDDDAGTLARERIGVGNRRDPPPGTKVPSGS